MPTHLIVAYQTAGGRPLREAVDRLIQQDPDTELVLLVPATHTQHLFTWTEGEARAAAQEKADETAAALRAGGIQLAAVRVGEADPFAAVETELRDHPGYDSIIVSTFPVGISRWLNLDLPSRIEKSVGLPVTHVVTEPNGG